MEWYIAANLLFEQNKQINRAAVKWDQKIESCREMRNEHHWPQSLDRSSGKIDQ